MTTAPSLLTDSSITPSDTICPTLNTRAIVAPLSAWIESKAVLCEGFKDTMTPSRTGALASVLPEPSQAGEVNALLNATLFTSAEFTVDGAKAVDVTKGAAVLKNSLSTHNVIKATRSASRQSCVKAAQRSEAFPRVRGDDCKLENRDKKDSISAPVYDVAL